MSGSNNSGSTRRSGMSKILDARVARATESARLQKKLREKEGEEEDDEEHEEFDDGNDNECTKKSDSVRESKDVERDLLVSRNARFGYDDVQRRLQLWRAERQRQKGQIEIAVEFDEAANEEKIVEMKRTRVREETKRARDSKERFDLMNTPWKSPRLSARRRTGEQSRSFSAAMKTLLENSYLTPAEIYIKCCDEDANCRISSRVLKALDQNTTTGVTTAVADLKTLDVSREPLGDAGAKAISKAIEKNKHCEALIFVNCQVGMVGFLAICESALNASRSFGVLKVLDLSDSLILSSPSNKENISSSSRSQSAATLPSVLYQLIENLKVIKLNGCGICEIHGNVAKSIADALASPNCSLEILEISRTKLGNRGAKKIGDALTKNRTLKKLDISLNDFSSRGCVSIAHGGLRENTHLKELNISWNSIGDIGGVAVGKALEFNRALRTLDLTQCAIAEEATIQISKGLRKNTTLKELKMDHNRCGETGGKKLMAMLTKNDCLTTLTLDGVSFSGITKYAATTKTTTTRTKSKTVVSTASPSQKNDKLRKNTATPCAREVTSVEEMDIDDDDDDNDDDDKYMIEEVNTMPEVVEVLLGTPRIAGDKVSPQAVLPSWSDSPFRQTPIDEEDLLNLLQQLKSKRLSDFERVSRLQMVRSAYLFTAAQVARLTQTFFLPSTHRLAAAAACMPRIIDAENAIDTIMLRNGFGFRDYDSAQKKLEQLYGKRNALFRAQNPTGRYRFDLGIDSDRALAQRLADIASNDEMSRQRFGGKSWRNVSIDDGPCVPENLTEAKTGIPLVFFETTTTPKNERRRKRQLKLPERGTLSLDFSSIVTYASSDGVLSESDHDLVQDVENVESYLFRGTTAYDEERPSSSSPYFSSTAAKMCVLREKAAVCWYHPLAANKLIFFFPKGAFRVEALVALVSRIPTRFRDLFSRLCFSLGQLSGIEQCVVGTRLGWRNILGTNIEQLTFRARFDCSNEEDFNVAKYLCERASEAGVDQHCRIRNVLINERKMAKDPVQDSSLWSLLTAESVTPVLEFDYLGADETILRSLCERELASSSSAAAASTAPLGSARKDSFSNQLRKLGNKLNFARVCEVHHYHQFFSSSATQIPIITSAEEDKRETTLIKSTKNTTTTATTTTTKKKKNKKTAIKPPSTTKTTKNSSTRPETQQLPLIPAEPFETFYRSYFLHNKNANAINSSQSQIKQIFNTLDKDGGGTLSLYEFKRGAIESFGVRVPKKILDPYFPCAQASSVEKNETNNENVSQNFNHRQFQEGVVDYLTFEKICLQWMCA